MVSTRKRTGGFFSRAFRRLSSRSSGGAGLSDGQRRAVRFGVVAAALVVVLLLLRGLLRLFFFGGEVFGIEVPAQKVGRIEITSGEAVPKELLLKWLEFNEGMPYFNPDEGLFARDLARRQTRVLKAAPALVALSISRTSSNVVTVVATERSPLAKFKDKDEGKSLVIDREGVVFRRPNVMQLPEITGYATEALYPGDRITSHRMIAAALELLQCLEAGQSELRRGFIVSIDVSKIDYIGCEFTDGRHAMLAWKEMGRGTETSRKWLIAQLDGYVAAIQNPRGRNLREFDLTIPGHSSTR